jgi:nucleoside-triphosphatase THEP1
VTFFLTGPIDSGKTSFLRALIPLLLGLDVDVRGVLSPARSGARGKLRYDVQSVRGGPKRLLLRRTPQGPATNPSGFAFGRRLLAKAADAQFAVVDEYGPLELSGRGFHKATLALVRKKTLDVLIVVREGLAAEAARSLRVRRPVMLDLGEAGGRDKAAAKIVGHLLAARARQEHDKRCKRLCAA